MGFSQQNPTLQQPKSAFNQSNTGHVVGDPKKDLKKGGRGNASIPPSIEEFRKYGFNENERNRIIRGWKLFNQIKAKSGLAPKPIVLRWCQFAKYWSKIQNRIGMRHSSTFGRIGATGENIAKGQRNILEAMRVWYHSPGHFANIKRARGFGFYGFDRGAWTMLG